MSQYVENELSEACKICSKFKVEGQRDGPHFSKDLDVEQSPIRFLECGWANNHQSRCLPKDRAIIILLDKLLKKLE